MTELVIGLSHSKTSKVCEFILMKSVNFVEVDKCNSQFYISIFLKSECYKMVLFIILSSKIGVKFANLFYK